MDSPVVVDFDRQWRNTKMKQRDLNPEWDEKLLVYDNESTPAGLGDQHLNEKKAAKRNTFLGIVKIPGNTFAKSDAAALVYFSLENRSVFSQIWVFSFLGVQNLQSPSIFFNVSKIS